MGMAVEATLGPTLVGEVEEAAGGARARALVGAAVRVPGAWALHPRTPSTSI
jgi:hypothetical protein